RVRAPGTDGLAEVVRAFGDVPTPLEGRWFVWFGCCWWCLDDGSAGGWFGGVAVSGGCGQGDGSVGVVDRFPAPGGGVFDDVVVLAERCEVAQGGGAGLGERD